MDRFSGNKNIQINYYSENDSGMYDALAKGFESERDTSDIYSYINAGDYYSQYAFEIVAEIFDHNHVHFITGINCWYNEKSHLIHFSFPFSYNKNLLLKGYYGTVLPHIQQESTFWGCKVHKKIDLNKLRECRLAGDYYLWKTFIKDTPLYIVSACLGGFKYHKGQLSSKFADEYKEEIASIAITPAPLDYLIAYVYKIMNNVPVAIKKKLSSHTFEYDNGHQVYKLTKHPSR